MPANNPVGLGAVEDFYFTFAILWFSAESFLINPSQVRNLLNMERSAQGPQLYVEPKP